MSAPSSSRRPHDAPAGGISMQPMGPNERLNPAATQDWPGASKGSRKRRVTRTAEDVKLGAEGRERMLKDTKRRVARREVKNILLTLFYLLGITVLCINGFSSDLAFYTADNAARALTEATPPKEDWDQLSTVSDIYDFVKTTYLPALLTSDSFDGVRRPNRTLLGVNYIVGPVRYGVVRVNKESCPSAPAFVSQAMFECFPSFSEEHENTTSHVGLPWRRDDAEPWDWTMIGVHYPPPGIFELIFPEDPLTTTVARMEELEQAGFIDIATRVVYLDAVLFNPTYNHVILVRLIAELLPSGGAICRVIKRLLEPTLFHSGQDWVQMIFQGLVLLQTIYYLFVEVARIVVGCRDVNLNAPTRKSGSRRRAGRTDRCRYFRSFTNVLALVSYVFILVSAMYRVAAIAALPNHDTLDLLSKEYVHLALPERLDATAIRLFSIGAYMIWIKLLAYLSIAPQFALLTKTLEKAWKSIYSFMFMLFIVFFATSLSHLLVFSQQLYHYRTIGQSMYSMMLSLLGEFDFWELYQIAPVVAPFLFVSYVLLCVIVALNVLIGIITAAFDNAKEEIENAPARPIVGELYNYVMSTLEKVPGLGRLVQRRQELLDDIVRTARVVEMQGRKRRGARRRSRAASIEKASARPQAMAGISETAGPGSAPAVTSYVSSEDEEDGAGMA